MPEKLTILRCTGQQKIKLFHLCLGGADMGADLKAEAISHLEEVMLV